jgi:hypothetical protein
VIATVSVNCECHDPDTWMPCRAGRAWREAPIWRACFFALLENQSRKILCYAYASRTTLYKYKEKDVLGKVILWFSALVFISYGLACLYSPALPAGYAGLAMTNGDALAEIRAMYGGLQFGFGIFCLLGALRKDFFRPVLASVMLLLGGLALARLYSTATGIDPVTSYTYGALVFECTTAALAALALRKR